MARLDNDLGESRLILEWVGNRSAGTSCPESGSHVIILLGRQIRKGRYILRERVANSASSILTEPALVIVSRTESRYA